MNPVSSSDALAQAEACFQRGEMAQGLAAAERALKEAERRAYGLPVPPVTSARAPDGSSSISVVR